MASARRAFETYKRCNLGERASTRLKVSPSNAWRRTEAKRFRLVSDAKSEHPWPRTGGHPANPCFCSARRRDERVAIHSPPLLDPSLFTSSVVSLEDIFEFLNTASGVFYRYYFTPKQLVNDKTTIAEVKGYVVVIIGFFVALPLLNYNGSVFGKTITDQTVSQLLFEAALLLILIIVSLAVGGLQAAIGHLLRTTISTKYYLLLSFYCVATFLCVILCHGMF
jgi:hypothetical protein